MIDETGCISMAFWMGWRVLVVQCILRVFRGIAEFTMKFRHGSSSANISWDSIYYSDLGIEVENLFKAIGDMILGQDLTVNLDVARNGQAWRCRD